MRDYLVFVRAGLDSLHPRLIAEDPGRNWDCCVSWYSPPREEHIAEYYEAVGENKFEAFEAFFLARMADRPYRYYLVLDPDVYFRPGDVSRFLALCDRHGLFLAQPSLRWGTNANFIVTLWNPVCAVRQVSYVEVMTPCFSFRAVEELLGTFRLSRSTWGIDTAWSSMLRDSGRIAIVDAVRVEHTKPADLSNGLFYQRMRDLGVDPTQEHSQVKATFPHFGELRTLRSGHEFASPLSPPIGRLATAFAEAAKKPVHKFLRLAGRLNQARHLSVARRSPRVRD
jgi:hypothetical protein